MSGAPSDPTYPAFPVLAILGAVVALVPLPWHFQAWNAGTCLFMIWTSIACLNLAINAIVWSNNALNPAPVWCDISSRIIVATGVALPAASLCIQRRLYNIATIKTVSITRAEKRKGILIDLAIGVGIPLLQILFQYIVSGHRFDIYEGIGCYPYTYNTPLAYPFSLVWPLVIALVSACYCVLTFAAFLRRRAHFNAYLASNTSLTANRYFRLMGIASVEIVCTVPISAYGLYLNLTAAPVSPWISWADTHFNYSKVDQFPAALWRMDRTAVVSFELSRWLAPFCAFVFFGFFGFAQEARSSYRKAFLWVCHLLPFRTLFPERPPKGAVSIEKAAGWHTKQDMDTLPQYSVRPPRPPPLTSFTSSARTEDTLSMSDTPYYEKFPETPSTADSDLSHDGLPHHGPLTV
ncbi:B mating type pheromone receptor [Trametes coccinea BRFM310]|uniref:B mating type pheromone receptor n=1 Tax=Trametes coccinea (strain BRFM310) TaxID=1353009 RepID=A0A1Y2IRM7_TRAC3|nr:B mating type pheromone receptor [Trametes coccinea BRFM310]